MPAVSTQLNDFILPFAPREAGTSQPKISLFGRLARAFTDARTQQAEREIARMIERGGGRLTDDMERQIERHLA